MMMEEPMENVEEEIQIEGYQLKMEDLQVIKEW